jgi:hypothetical protein
MRPWHLLTQDIATAHKECSMAEKNEPRQPTHRAYSVIGLVFEHKDGKGFNIVLQAFPLDGKIVCREIADDGAKEPEPQQASVHSIKSSTRRR